MCTAHREGVAQGKGVGAGVVVGRGTSVENQVSAFPLLWSNFYFSVPYTMRFQLDAFYVRLWGFLRAD